jgi:cell division protein ZapA
MKQVDVTILGQVYVLGCPEGGEVQLATAVAAVDKEMTAIKDSGRVKARERIAVLAALNLAYQLAERASTPANPTSMPVHGAANGAVKGLVNGAAPAAAPAVDALLRRVDAALADDGQLL